MYTKQSNGEAKVKIHSHWKKCMNLISGTKLSYTKLANFTSTFLNLKAASTSSIVSTVRLEWRMHLMASCIMRQESLARLPPQYPPILFHHYNSSCRSQCNSVCSSLENSLQASQVATLILPIWITKFLIQTS